MLIMYEVIGIGSLQMIFTNLHALRASVIENRDPVESSPMEDQNYAIEEVIHCWQYVRK